jgi:hypothetical protein
MSSMSRLSQRTLRMDPVDRISWPRGHSRHTRAEIRQDHPNRHFGDREPRSALFAQAFKQRLRDLGYAEK